MPEFIPLEDMIAEMIVIDVEAMVTAGVAERLADLERQAFIRAVASGVPASEAYSSTWRRRRD